MNIRFQRDVYANYMVLEKVRGFSPNHYAVQMLSRNQIRGLLPFRYVYVNGQYDMHYDITSRQAFSKLFEVSKIRFAQARAWLWSLKELLENLQEHLLDADNVILKRECIFADPEGLDYAYCYDPYYRGNFSMELGELLDQMLRMVDYEDEQAVRFVYEMQGAAQNSSFVFEDLLVVYERCAQQSMPKVQKLVPQVSVTEENFLEEDEKLAWDWEDPAKTPHPVWKELPENDGARENTSLYKKASYDAVVESEGYEAPGFFEKVRLYFKHRPFRDILEDFNNGEVMENIRAASEPPMIPERLRPETALLPQPADADSDLPEIETTVFSLEEFAASFAEEGTYSKPAIGEHAAGTILLQKSTTGRRLVGLKEQEGVRFSVETFPFTVGKRKEESDACIEEEAVSRMHARIHKDPQKPEGYLLEDLNSTNGTFLNGERIEAYRKMPLAQGDVIQFAGAEFCFR